MRQTNKVIWSEGTFVTPQHFQQQERYFEDQLEQHLQAYFPYRCGVLDLKIDQKSLSESSFAIGDCFVVFPDGTVFKTPQVLQKQNISLPKAKTIPADTSRQIIYLAIPRQSNASEVSSHFSEQSMARYIRGEVKLLDYNDDNASNFEEIGVAYLNCRLLLESEERSGYSCIELAQIEYVKNDIVTLNKKFIPPGLNCHSSPLLKDFLKETFNLFTTQAQAVEGFLRDDEYGRNFLLLQLLKRYQASFRYCIEMPVVSPDSFYHLLIRAINELSIYYPDITQHHYKQYEYQHHDLEKTFPPLMELLRRYLAMSIDVDVSKIPLNSPESGLNLTHMGEQSDINLRDLLTSAKFYLAVKSSAGADTIKSNFAKQVKIGSSSKIRRMVALLVPGVKIKLCSHIPPRLPFDESFVYFEFDQDGEDWIELQQSNGIGIYADDPFQEADFILWAIRNKQTQ